MEVWREFDTVYIFKIGLTLILIGPYFLVLVRIYYVDFGRSSQVTQKNQTKVGR